MTRPARSRRSARLLARASAVSGLVLGLAALQVPSASAAAAAAPCSDVVNGGPAVTRAVTPGLSVLGTKVTEDTPTDQVSVSIEFALGAAACDDVTYSATVYNADYSQVVMSFSLPGAELRKYASTTTGHPNAYVVATTVTSAYDAADPYTVNATGMTSGTARGKSVVFDRVPDSGFVSAQEAGSGGNIGWS